MPLVAQLIGGAGTAKTSRLMDTMDKVLDHIYDPHLVGFCSFTRAARAEAASRAADRFGLPVKELESDGWFRTVHSICYRQLCVGKALLADNVESRKWLSTALDEDVGCGADAEGYQTFEGKNTDAAKALALWSTARNRLEPLRDAWNEARVSDSRYPGFTRCEKIVVRYEQAKRLDGRCDFADLLGRFSGWRFGVEGASRCEPCGEVPDLPVWFFDEQQDASALLDACCKRLVSAPACQWVYIAGDPFQCQPAGTLVLTAKGYRTIETLTDDDDLITFNIREGRFYGTGKHVPFQRASRTVDSSHLLEITMEDGTVHVSTENHRWYCRTQRDQKYGVCLMRKETRWRVGTVQMFAAETSKSLKKNSAWRLNSRCNQEAADEAWILGVFATDKEARAYEQIVSCKYGLPQVTFRPPSGRTNLDRWFIDTVFNGLGDLTVNGHKCVSDHGLCLAFPYWKKYAPTKNGCKASRVIHACNILPGITLLPKRNLEAWTDGRIGKRKGVYRKKELARRKTVEARVTWVPVKSVRRLPAGTPTEVFSMNVEKYHTYITKEYITCNSIFSFCGADPKYFLEWPLAKQEIQRKSYRCAAPILDVGEGILRGCRDYFDREIQPADHDGRVEKAQLSPSLLASTVRPDESWLVLTRTNLQARKLAHLLDDCLIPWVPTTGHGGWDAPVRNQAIQTLLGLEQGAPISGDQWQAVLKQITVKAKEDGGEPLLVRGTKARFEKMPPAEAAEAYPWITPDELDILGATPAFCQAIETKRWRNWIPEANRFDQAMTKWGREATAESKVRVGTIHSVKGQDADNVLLLTTITEQCRRAMDTDRGKDEENRVFYVGVTRAKRRLVVVNEEGVAYRKKVPA